MADVTPGVNDTYSRKESKGPALEELVPYEFVFGIKDRHCHKTAIRYITRNQPLPRHGTPPTVLPRCAGDVAGLWDTLLGRGVQFLVVLRSRTHLCHRHHSHRLNPTYEMQ